MAPLPPAAARIYTVHSLSATFVPRVVHKIRELLSRTYFSDAEYDTDISIVVGNISECTEALASSATPFMISYEDSKHRLLFSDEMLTTLFPADKAHVRKDRILSIRIASDRLIPVCAAFKYEQYQQMLKDGMPIPFSAYSNGTYLSALVNDKIKSLDLNVSRIGDAQMADTLRNLAREGDGIAWVLDSTAQNAINKKEIRPFDFGADRDTDVHLDIKLFRVADYSSHTIDRIWKVAKELEASLDQPATWLTKPC